MSTLQKVTERAIKQAGGGARLAKALGLKSRQAVYQWKEVPPKHVLRVEQFSGVPRHELRPDLYPRPREQMA